MISFLKTGGTRTEAELQPGLAARSSLLFYPNAGGNCVFTSLARILPHNLLGWASFKRISTKEMKGKEKGWAVIGHQVLGKKALFAGTWGFV